MEIYWYQDGDSWCVDAAGDTTTHGSRAEAFAHARHLALTNPGSQLAKGRRADAAAARGADDEQPDPMLWIDQEPGWSDDRRDDARDTRDGVESSDRSGPGRYSPAKGATRRATTAGRSTSPERGAAGRPAAAPPPPTRRRRAAGPVDWAQLAGPAPLGRSILLAPDAPVPAPWADADDVPVTFAGDPADLLAVVRAAFLERRRMVYRVPVDLVPPSDALTSVDVWSLPVDFELVGDAAWYLLVANAVDARDLAAPFFPWTEAALDAGATPVTSPTPQNPSAPSATSEADPSREADDGEGEVVLPGGSRAWCDGGPLQLAGDPLGVVAGSGAAPGAVVVPRVAVEQRSLVAPDRARPTADLAPDQLEAVAEAGGRARIIAPAGSGKTRVLTERARFLLGTKQIPAPAVTMVAFNKRAQLEMQDRTADLPGLQIQTLNALALAVLNGGRGFRDRGERVRTIDELAVRKLLGDLVSFPRRANTDPAAAWIDALSAVRLGLRSPQEVEADFGGDVDGLTEVFGRYRRALAQQGAVDFDDQIYRAIEVLLAEPATRQQAQRMCRLLMVDEFQDLTPAHLLLLRLLAGPELDIFGVGDDDQTIYGYSGASPRWLIDFERFVPGATHHALEVNYRCPPAVVEAASNLLSHNSARVPKTIRAGRADDAPATAPTRAVPVITIDGHDEPAERTVEHIVALLDAGAAPRDIVVLTRVNTTLAPIQAALFERAVPCANRDGARFLERTGVAAALSWLAIATGGGRLGSMHVQRAARRPGRSLSPKLIEWMADQHDTAGLSRLAGRLKNEKDADKVIGFVTDIERISALARRAPTATILEFVRADIGLDRAMQTLDAAHRGRNATAHSDDLRALISLGRLHPDASSFSSWLPTVLGGGRDDDGVQLSTVHKVKGLEWPHVIVHDATQGLFPHHLSTDIEEERRVFHVAITRCQRSLVLVADLERPSMFLTELEHAAPAEPADRTGRERPAGPVASSRTGSRPDVADLAAAVGLSLSWGGYDGEIGAIEADHVVLLAGRAEFSIAFGALVTVAGRPRRLVSASATTLRAGGRGTKAGAGGPSPVDLPPEHAHLLDALKAWRRERSRTDGVPAYVVANDRTLTEIAAVVPRTPAALLKISGIGSAKLENYGDEMLAVIDDAAPPA